MWSSKNDLRPEEVALGTNKKYWFDCHICNHSYEQSPTKKTSLCNGCPYCSGHKICGLVDCKFCLIKSCYIYSESWSSKNKLNPEEVAISSSIKVRFNCKVCNHDYVQKPSDKTNKSTKCPYCANKKLCGDLKCTFCLLKTCYIYGEIWSSKNLMHPEEVAISSHKKYWFYCKKCKQDYEQNPRNKTNNKQSCPRCVNKTERIVDDYFKDYEIEFNTQLKINSSKRYDFCLPKYKLIIEIDGDQHFKQVNNWGCYKKTLESDIQKMKVALDNGYSVLRIYQPDIFNERLNWRQTILDNMYIRTKPDITCVSSNPEIYNNHINLKE
jgi:very-short-patch-repair endonuclease